MSGGSTDFQVRIRTVMDINDAVSNIGAIQRSLNKLKLPEKIGQNLSKNINEFYKEYEKYQKRVANGIKTQSDYNQAERSLNRIKQLYSNIGRELQKTTKLDIDDIIDLGNGNFKKIADEISNVIKQINSIKVNTKPIADAKKEIENLTRSKKISGEDGILNRIMGHLNKGEITEAKNAFAELKRYAEKAAPRQITNKNGKSVAAPGTMSADKYKALQSAIAAMESEFTKADAKATPFINKLNQLQKELSETKQAAGKDILGGINKYRESERGIEKVTDSLKRMHQEEFSFKRQTQDIDRQIQSYFGLAQMIRKVGDIARAAFETVKELDAAMVETAVVTNFDVGDMWGMLPEYTAQANELGSTIKDVYEAATLYFQQGLNKNQSLGLANETLKMARIGGLQAAEATNMMTAALRGFNMEINGTSAQRINDVYSELAAITAADTKEIGSAMERTASIADSANMEFETTSAFLAQMIETTREAPENLGTAMKTIIARFQEMKMDPTKLVDSEGVAMDANRVDTALKTIGVNLTNSKGEFNDLDDVFLQISEKWDSLTQGQQRYIATIAAGARQQSRFIAMMQNHERVMELVDAANNSAGASQKQFEKTLDSMASKLNRLKNAWNQFTMGLMNDKIIKGSIDGLTKSFTVINKILDVLGKIPPKPFEGITKSALTLATTLGMLNIGKKMTRGTVMGVAGWWKHEGGFTENFKQGYGAGEATASAKKTAQVWGQTFKQDLSRQNLFQNVFTATKEAKKTYDTTLMGAYGNYSKGAFKVANNSGNFTQIETDLRNAWQKASASSSQWGGEAGQKYIDGIVQKIKAGKSNIRQAVNQIKADTQIDLSGAKVATTDGKSTGAQQLDKFAKEGTKIEAFGQKVTNAGSAVSYFGTLLQATPLAPFGTAVSMLGMTISTFGSNLTSCSKLFRLYRIEATATMGTMKALGRAVWESFGPIAIVMAAVVAAIGVFKLIDKLIVTDKERLEEASDAAAKASEAFDLANQELSELRDSITKVREADAAFDNLVVGTAAFNEQLVTTNQLITELVNKYPMLMNEGYVSTDENGLMHISEEGLKAVEDYQKKIQARASAVSIIQAADLAAEENRQKAKKLREDWDGGTEEHKKNVERAKLLEEQAEAQKEVNRQNAIRTALNGTEVQDVEALSSVYLDLYESKRKAAEQDIQGLDKHAIRQKYADYHGYGYDKSTGKIKDVEGNEVEVEDKIVKDEVIEQTVLLDFEENASSLERTLEDLDTVFNESLANNLKGADGANTFISDILSNNIETNEDLLKQVLSENSTDFQSLVNKLSEEEVAAILGISADSVTNADYGKVTDLLTEKAKNIVETQSKSYEDLGAMLAKTKGWDIVTAAQAKNQKEIVDDIETLKSQQAHMMSKVGSQLEEGAGVDTMKNYIGYMNELYKEINTNSKFGNIDLDNREKLFNDDGSISTVLGGWGVYGEEEVTIAFSPMLQTGTGTPKKLDKDTINNYLDAVLSKAGKGASIEDILEIDANPEKFGLNTKEFKADGYQIKGLIADIGDTAVETSTKMHEIEDDKGAAAEIEKIFEADVSTATGRLKAYNDLSNSSLRTTRELGETLMKLPESSNLLGDVFDEFLGGELTELEEHIDDFKNSAGEFDNAGILEMSKSSKTLKTLLDSGQVSATGFAKALQGIEDGSISQVNSTVLQLLSSLNRLEDAAMEAHNIVENFDAGIDTGEGEDFVQENAKAVKEYMSNNEWGNQQLENYIKLAAGEERWNETLRKNHGDLKKTTKALDDYVTKFSDGFQPAYDDMIAGKGLNGKSLTDNINKAIEQGNISKALGEEFKKVKTYWDDNGFMQWDFSNLTTDQLEQYFQEAYGVSEEYAKLFLQDILNYNETEAAELAANDLKAVVGTDEFKQNHQDVNGNLTLTSDELYMFEQAGGDLKELAEAAHTTTAELRQNAFAVSEDGVARKDYPKLLDDYAKKFFDVGKQGAEGLFNQSTFQTQGQFDIAKLISDAQQKGLNDDQAMRAAYEMYKTAQEQDKPMLYEGMELKDGLVNYEEFAEEIKSLTDSSEWVTVGQTIGQQIVSALQGSNFLEKVREGDAAAAFTKTGFQEGAFTQVVEAVAASGENTKQQQQDIQTYLAQSRDQFVKMNPEQQTTALQGIVNKLNQLNFSPSEIAAALKGGIGIDLPTKGDKALLTGKSGEVKLDTSSEELQDKLSNLKGTITLEPDMTQVNKSLTEIDGSVYGVFAGWKGAASGQNNPNSAFHRTGTMARGSRGGYTISGRPTLTGEDGEELVWEPKRNEAYMVGSNGPQFANISKDAVVWNADQTKRIKKNSGTVGRFGTSARGIIPLGTMAGGNAAGGGRSKIPGTFGADVIGNIKEVTQPAKKPEVPVKAKLEVEGNKGGFLNKIKGLFGKGQKNQSIKVTAEATKVTIPEGIKSSVKVTGEIAKLVNKAGRLSGVKATAAVTKVIKSGKVTGEPVTVNAKAVVSGKASGAASTATVKTKADNTAQKSINSIKHSGAVIIRTKADNTAQRAINSIKDKDVTIHITPSFEGTWTKNATVKVKHAAKGQNNYIAHRTTPQIGSAAMGRYGRLGPKGKGGPTLTGEKGFEIAWLPSESRSLILGANGPQMIDLPKDAVVWTNEQSKKILKQEAIPAGSHGGRHRPAQKVKGSGGGGGGGGGGRGGKGSSKKTNKTTTKILEKAGKINLWWWNMTKKVEATQREIDKITKSIKKEVPAIGASLKNIAPKIADFVKKTSNQISYNTEMRNKAQSSLNRLDSGDATVDNKVEKARKKLAAAQKKLKKAQKTKSKKSIKKQQKNVKRAKKELSKAQTGTNYSSISYQQTKQVTKKQKGKKAKTTKKKVTRKQKINLAPYIKFDEESGAYQVDYQKINSKFGKNKSKAKAIGDAATKKIEDLTSKRNTAEDNITKAEEELEQLSKEVAEAFLTWRNELTEVYDLTQRIANESSFIDRFDSQIEMELASLKAGFGDMAKTISNTQSVLIRKNDMLQKQIEDQQQMIGARQRELDDALSSKDEQERIDIIKAMDDEVAGGKEVKEAAIKILEDEKLIADSALGYITNVFRDLDGSVQYNIDWDRFNQDRAKEPINTETYEKIKSYLDDVNSKTTDFNDSIKTQTDFIAQVYNTLEEYQDYIVSFEDTIIKGVEEQINNETENFKKLSDSLSNNLKDLLDEVKRKLDERRQQEDNAKTERDISQKQQRLAALRADTSGNHRVEIAQLEKEIAEAQQSYQRTLEDQQLEKLQQQADIAQKQRERQIELAEASNDLSAETNKELVNLWLSDPEQYQDKIKQAWLEAKGFEEMGIAEQAKTLNEWQSVFSELMAAIKQSGFNSEKGTFKETGEGISTLVDLVTQIANGLIGREEATASAFGAQQDVTNRNIGTISDYAISSENAKYLKENFKATAGLLKEHGFGLEELIGSDTNNPIYSVSELKEADFKIQDLLSAGLNINQLKEGGYDAKDFHEANFSDINKLIEGGFTVQDLKQGGYVASDFYNNKITYDKVRETFDFSDLAQAGYTEAFEDLRKIEEEKEAARREAEAAERAKTLLKEYQTSYAAAKKAKEKGKTYHWLSDGSDADKYYSFLLNGKGLNAEKFDAIVSRGSKLGFSPDKVARDLAATKQFTWEDILKAAKKSKKYSKEAVSNWSTKKDFKTALNKWEKYKSGGLASYTGPAWLDGTPSKPELVLNAQDTKNFIALRDVLDKAVGSANSVTNTNETAMYEININVDHINSDYDVDKIAARIKKDIIKDAGYRNVTQVRNFR